MMARIGRAGAALLLGLATACSGEAPPSILLISVDSLRADRLGSYGAERDTSPAIDALAAEGLLFTNAMAPTSWTLPSHVTLLTGLSTAVHRVNGPKRQIDPARRLLAQVLAEQGYATAAFVSAPYLHRRYGFDRGFARYQNLQAEVPAFPPSEGQHERSHLDQTAESVVDAALAWLKGQPPGEKPWFAFVHLWDVHYDYLPPPPFDALWASDYAGPMDGHDFLADPLIRADMPAEDLAELRLLYDREVRALDAQIARLLLAVSVRERDERVVVTLVSDHGDEFFEHGHKGHTRTLFEESVHVPWILRDSLRRAAGTRVTSPVSLADVAPTLLGLAGLAPLSEATGRDLSALLLGKPVPERPALLTFPPFAALRGEDWKLIVHARTGVAQYFDLRRDPNERVPLPAPREKLLLLQRRLEAERAHAEALRWEGAPEVELDSETRARLRELGYAE